MEEPVYQSVDPRYTTQLRIEAILNWGLAAIVATVLVFIVEETWRWLPAIALIIIALTLIVLLLMWAPRRYTLTGYKMNSLDVHFRTGALWRLQTAVPINRVQHVEISQGPLERLLGLARLVLYTAGGVGSNLAIPGLRKAHAESMRSELLGLINNEQDS